jgi:hypothetical protein
MVLWNPVIPPQIQLMNTLKPLCVETEETNDFSSEHPTI